MTTATQYGLIDNRYQLLSPLGSGGMGAVYRAYDRLTGQILALKQVTIEGNSLEFASQPTVSGTLDYRLSLAQEFKTLATLRHPHIISVLDYGFTTPQDGSERQPFFTMDLLQNVRTILRAGRHFPLQKQIDFLIQTLHALAYLHRRGIIHRDLKPDNVLVVEDEHVKVLDFGLAIGHDQIDERVRRGSSQIAGTLAYLAPEVLQGLPASRASDLYGIGIIAYELLSGRHPFANKDITQLIYSITHGEPLIEAVGENIALQNIIGKLLSKNPYERFNGDAYTVIAALSEAIDRRFTQESAAVRESFLQAAKFVGREEELSQLEDALHAAMSGDGSAWLIGGESGVGKSRLLDELRARALVEGVLVLRGQGVSDGGGLSYQLWREPLRRMALSVHLTDLEASVLKELVADLETLIGRIVPHIGEMLGESGQHRLLFTIAEVFRKAKRPILLILEDLQWATESLEVLTQHLLRSVPELSLMVVGTYRDDERPDLPEKLSGMEVMKLSRFDSETVAELSVSMLGEVGAQPDVIDLLQRETEGNVFFLIEVVRALAEDAGSLHDVGTVTLPQTVVAGGMLQIVRRRLERVPEEYRPILELAAVSGRRIDLKLLRYLLPDANLENWLTACVNAAVLTNENEAWVFAHDKLREGVLNKLSADERIHLHRQVAEALEMLYPNIPSIANVLAHHWQMVEDRGKEHHYRMLAGEALLNGAYYREAYSSFERAMALVDGEASIERARTKRLMAECLIQLGEYETAWVLLEEAFLTAQREGDLRLIAQVLHRQGDIRDLQGKRKRAEAYLRQSVKVYRQIGDPELLADGLRSLGTCTYGRGRVEEALRYHEEGLAIYRRIGNRLKVAQSENNIANLIGNQGDHFTAKAHLEAALEILRAYDDRKGVANCLNNLGVNASNRNDLKAALYYYREAVRLSKEIGSRQGVIIGFYNMGEIGELMDDDIAARDYYYQGLREAVGLQAVSLITAFMTGIARLKKRSGDDVIAAEWFGMLLHHPSMINEVKEQLTETLDSLRHRMGVEAYEEAIERGKSLDLDREVKRILNQEYISHTPDSSP
jgi:eukaryotic-like serine/threonine-protein kinase